MSCSSERPHSTLRDRLAMGVLLMSWIAAATAGVAAGFAAGPALSHAATALVLIAAIVAPSAMFTIASRRREPMFLWTATGVFLFCISLLVPLHGSHALHWMRSVPRSSLSSGTLAALVFIGVGCVVAQCWLTWLGLRRFADTGIVRTGPAMRVRWLTPIVLSASLIVLAIVMAVMGAPVIWLGAYLIVSSVAVGPLSNWVLWRILGRYARPPTKELLDLLAQLTARCRVPSPPLLFFAAGDMPGVCEVRYDVRARLLVAEDALASYSTAETEAILAHELGHIRYRHVEKKILITAALSLVVWVAAFAVLQSTTRRLEPWWAVSSLCALASVRLLAEAAFSRRFETQADAFAAGATGVASLVSALGKVSSPNESRWRHLGPMMTHPFPRVRQARLSEPLRQER